MSETLLSKAKTRARLEIGRARYEQLVAGGILEKPFELTSGGRPVHSESQILRCERALRDLAVRDYLERQRQFSKEHKPMKPLSEKLLAEIG